MLAVGGQGRTGTLQFLHQALDFGADGAGARGGARPGRRADSPPEISANSKPRTRRLARPSRRGMRSTAGSAATLSASCRSARRGAAAGIEVRIQVAVIAGIEALHGVFRRVSEQLEARGGGVQAQQAQGQGAMAAGGDVEGQPLQGHAGFARAQVRQPDEAESQDLRGIPFGRAGDGRPAVLAVLQERARKGRRKAEFQVGFGAQLGQVPLGKLAAQEQAEPLAKNQAVSAAAHFGAGASGQVEQEKRPLAPGKALHREFQAGGGGSGDAGDATVQVARAVPGLQREAAGAQFEREIIAFEGQQILAGFEQRGLARGAEERIDGRADLLGTSGCWLAIGRKWRRGAPFPRR